MKKKLTPDDVGAKIIGVMDFLLDLAVMILFLLLILFSIYSIWDVKNLYDAGDCKVFEEYKPSPKDDMNFKDLQKINPDVKCWLTVYGTGIDYPVVYSHEDGKYLNMDAKGKYALSGSLFFDTDCAPDFSDHRTIIYGHHMDKDKMFGGLDHFRDKKYFRNHRYGNVFYNGRDWGLDIFGVMESDAYDSSVYGGDGHNIEQVIRSRAIHLRDIELNPSDHIVLLSTCAGGLTNNRLIVTAKLTDETYDNPFGESGGEKGSLLDRIPKWWYAVLAFLLGLFVLLIHLRKKQREDKEENEEKSY